MLYDDLLIRVTHFFRDPATFDALKRLVFPALIRDRPKGCADPAVGGGLLDGRGSVLTGDGPAGKPRRPGGRSAAEDPGDGHR